MAIGVVVALLAVAPVLMALATRVGRSYLPVQDLAIIDLRLRDVWSTDIPLVGAYSRYRWSHPGPMMYWLSAPLSLISGRAAWATQASFVILQGVAIVWLCVLAWRRGGLATLSFWAAILMLGYGATGSWMFLEPWNPHVAFPFFVLLLLQGWLVMNGEFGRLPGALIVGSFLAQTHLGYVPLVAAVGLAMLPALIAQVRAGPTPLMSQRWWRRSLLVLAVLWTPVVLETVVYWPGNIAAIIHFLFLKPSEPRIGLGSALGLLASEFRPVPHWLGGELLGGLGPAAESSVAWLLVPLLALGAGFSGARRTASRSDRNLIVLATAVLVASVVALSGVTGDSYPYLFYWRELVAPFVLLASALAIGRAVGRWRPRELRAIAVAALLVPVVWNGIGLAHAVAVHPKDVNRFEAPTRELLDQLADQDAPKGSVLLRFAGSPLGGAHGGVFDELVREGKDVRFDEGRPYQFGHSRQATPEQVDEVWYVVEEHRVLVDLLAMPGATIIAETHPLSDAELAEWSGLQREVLAAFRNAGRDDLEGTLDSFLVGFVGSGVPGVDNTKLTRLAAINEVVLGRVCHCGIVRFDPADAPSISLRATP